MSEHKSRVQHLASFNTREESDEYIEKAKVFAKKKGLMDVRFTIERASSEKEEFGFKYDVFGWTSNLSVVNRKGKKKKD